MSQDNTSVVAWEHYVADDAFVAEEDVAVEVVATDVGESPLEQVAGFAMMLRPIQ